VESVSRLKVFTHQAWGAFVAQHSYPFVWKIWLNYVTNRYGYLPAQDS
jgi:hypothetical protein